jgi:hypothetical protein
MYPVAGVIIGVKVLIVLKCRVDAPISKLYFIAELPLIADFQSKN